MPVIRIDFDSSIVQESEAQALAEGVQTIVAAATKIEDVFVYANASQITVKIAPIEIFVQLSAGKIPDADALTKQIAKELHAWKHHSQFPHPINFTLIPMHWKIEIDV